VFGYAAEQGALESAAPMSGGHNQVNVGPAAFLADFVYCGTNPDLCFARNSAQEIHSREFAYLFPSGRLCGYDQRRYVGADTVHEDLSIGKNEMAKTESRARPLRQTGSVFHSSERTFGEIHWNKNFAQTETYSVTCAIRNRRLVLGAARNQNWTGCIANDTLSRTSQNNTFQPTVTPRRKND
jgi:hypothetical protein